MTKITLLDRLRYTFDNIMARGTIALIGWLFFLSALLVVVISTVVNLAGIGPVASDGTRLTPLQVTWITLLQTLNASLVVADLGNSPFLFAILVTTVSGILIVGTLIGILSSGIQNRVTELRKGRSLVVEEGHTVLLGWSSHIFSVVHELVVANGNQKRACIAILAEKDKVEMEDELRSKLGSTHTTRIVCRTGTPLDLTDLEIVNPHRARSIIIPSPDVPDPDTYVIKCILALTNHPARRPDRHHIVAEIRNPANLPVARMVARNEAQLILAGDLISRIIVQALRQGGLSGVYTELLDFEGDEIYFGEEPTLVGKTFGETLFLYADSAVIGVRTAQGEILLNPPMETRIGAGDKVIAISEDDSTLRISGQTDFGIRAEAIQDSAPTPRKPERMLILGWNDSAPTILRELDSFVTSGSEALVVADTAEAAGQIERLGPLRNERVTFQAGNTTDRATLDALNPVQFDHILTLSSSGSMSRHEADARSLVTLLHLRDIAEKEGKPLSIVSEMLDDRNRRLAEVTHADDFIVSEKLVSLMLVQVSENPEMAQVFAELFSPTGSDLFLKPARDYVRLGEAVNFYTVLEAARRRGEVAAGYRLGRETSDPAKGYGMHLNPDKGDTVTFQPGDRMIVLAENRL